MGFLTRNLQTCKMQLSALLVFKTREITSTVEFLSSEARANGFFYRINALNIDWNSQEGQQVYLKGKVFHHGCFLHIKLRKAKNKELARQNQDFCNADADADVNVDADAETPMPRFPNGHFYKAVMKLL